MPNLDKENFWRGGVIPPEINQKLSGWISGMSYEVLPTPKALTLVPQIPAGSDIRITCRPSGVEETLRFVERLGDVQRHRAIPHIAARRVVDDRHMAGIFKRLADTSITKIFVVAGDGQPDGGKYQSTQDVLDKIVEQGLSYQSIGIAGYPEGNSVFQENPTDILLRRQEYANQHRLNLEIVTQMCFEAGTLVDWLKDIRSRGVTLPIRVGTVGRLSADTLLKVVQAIGVRDSVAFLKSKPSLAATIGGNSALGYQPREFLLELARQDLDNENLGISGLSLFTLGNINRNLEYFSNA